MYTSCVSVAQNLLLSCLAVSAFLEIQFLLLADIISTLDGKIYGKDKKPLETNTEEEKWRK
jgi:hypothetical protein